MKEKAIIITNNVLSKNKFKDDFEVEFIDGTLMDVLIKVRDYVHLGHRLLTHPLSGSVKPNETPYKTVAISKSKGLKVHMESLILIENSIETSRKFLINKPLKQWPEKVLDDFKLIDFDLIYHAFN